MSVRGCRVWRRQPSAIHPPAVVVEWNKRRMICQQGVFMEIDSDYWDAERSQYTKCVDAYGLMGVLTLSREESVLIAITGVVSVGQLYNSDIYRVTGVEFVSLRLANQLQNGVGDEARIQELQRLISSGMFYFAGSAQLDLTLSAQRRAAGGGSDHRFFWNRCLHFPLERFSIDTQHWLLKCMVGSVLIRTVYVGHRTGRVAVLSRLSCERVGTRFNVRGANDMGCVANFVETEQLLVFDGQESSFVQIRGSIPLFWDQPGVQVGSHKVKLRAFEASAPAYHRHFLQLRQLYGELAVVNLLGHKEGERLLADAFRVQHKNSSYKDVPFIDFDYHAQLKINKENIGELRRKLDPLVARHGFFIASEHHTSRTQSGAIRTNCLDCLDRTNAVQTMLGLQACSQQLTALNIDAGTINIRQRLEEILKEVWQKNGDQCSIIYAGTGALEGKSKFKDASRSLARTIQNNLLDGSKQESFDLLLAGTSFENRQFDRAANLLPRSIIQEYASAVDSLVERSDEITEDAQLKIFVGTWNVNGGKNMHNVAFRNEAKLADWIFPQPNLVSVDSLDDTPDVVAIGVEELVDLNASNMMKASTTNQRLWCDGVRKTLCERAPYVLLGCEQLVGVCLFIFVRPRLAPFLRDFAVGSVKTGMGGATGNKGSVAFRMVVHSTSLCFVCSHFAAGQNEISARNDDWASAMRKLRFPQGRDIDSHDVVFWLGDFNYRISLGREEVKQAVRMGQLDALVPFDQLTQQRAEGKVFVEFEEGALSFPPTYKYDTFSDDYDTSEKCRSPAWTDRILWRDNRGKRYATQLIDYTRAELKTSDHRPVSAHFVVNVYRVEWSKCEALVEDVVGCMGPPDSTAICRLSGHPVFPPSAVQEVAQKCAELGATVRITKSVGAELHVVLDSGESALAALSMDGIRLRDGELGVRLAQPDWIDRLRPRIAEHDPSVEAFVSEVAENALVDDSFNFDDDDDDEEEIRVARVSPQQRAPPAQAPPPRPAPPPPRPAPPQARVTPSPQPALANLDWPESGPMVPPRPAAHEWPGC